jgi:hypothetical protein
MSGSQREMQRRAGIREKAGGWARPAEQYSIELVNWGFSCLGVEGVDLPGRAHPDWPDQVEDAEQEEGEQEQRRCHRSLHLFGNG